MRTIDEEFIEWVESDNLERVRDALNRGADVHFGCDLALRICAFHNRLEMATLLLENGANVHATDATDATSHSPMTCAAERGYLELVAVLLKYDANVDANDGANDDANDGANDDAKLLQFCVRYGYAKIISILLANGVDIHRDDDYALRISVIYGFLDIVKELLEYGANMYANGAIILINLQKNFSRSMADVLLPYCSAQDYGYFPDAYIKDRITPTKSAMTQ